MDKTQGKIGGRELFAIVILTIGTKLADDTPSVLYEGGNSAAWVVILIIGLISIFPIYFLTKVITCYRDKNLFDIIMHLFGNYIGFFVLMILWLILTYLIAGSSAVYTDIIGTMYFTKTPPVIIYGVLMTVAAYGAKKGLEHIGSTAWFTLAWIKISLFIVLIITLLQGEVSFLFPILGQGGWDIVEKSIKNTTVFIDFLFLGLIATSVKSTKVFKKGIWIGFFFIAIEFALALVGYVMLFDYASVQMVSYAYHETLRYVQLGFVTNVESIFFPFWLVAAFIRFSVYLYLSALLFGALFKIKEFNYIIPTLATLIVFLGMIPETPIFNMRDIREKLFYFTTPLFFLLPFTLWLTAKFKGEFKK